ncbi:hypothetical protein FEF26_08190 [Nesterenkonia salmonea]|uniref:Uncharacterized protein n=1 Tax=Nesterenkonia salmonea TaxID=1804987 RepID=A0A5R9BAQ9_9MICC|nr:hypothetical protein [Nesterenkonia salmonea]TLP97071.1 hypothetical protein FEF26_08190 [Nesterenkonia salmonea]
MEILLLLVLGLVLFLFVRTMMQRQAQKMNDRMQQEITPETARQAALALNDDQHKAVYQAIAAEDAKRAMMVFKQATGASVQDCLVAVQALFRFPQPNPSEIRFQEGFNLNHEDSSSEDVSEEYLEDAIDDVRDDADSAPGSDEGPLAEADPNTGEIVGENASNVPNIPNGQKPTTGEGDDDEIDARARELMEASGFDPDQELTIPEEWASEDEQAGFHLEVQRGDEKITLSHDDLEPWVHDQLYALLRDDHVDQAADLLAANSPLTTEEAHRFLVVFKNQG